MQKWDAGFSNMGLAASERHVFLCVGSDCCTEAAGMEVWETLKNRIRDLDIPVMRTKAACFRICCQGPWMAVYPDGIWYGEVTPERCARIIDEHLVDNQPVTEWIARQHPLG